MDEIIRANQKLISRRSRKIVDVALAVREQPKPLWAETVQLARPLVQATLPHRNPGDVPIWTRTNGALTLSIQPGYMTNPKTRQPHCVGYPYGSLPRLLLFWMNTEAVREKSRRLYLGKNLSEFLRELGLDYTRRGELSDARRLTEQMRRLFYSRITFEYSNDYGETRLAMEVAPKSQLWWNLKEPGQGVLWDSWIELGEDFHRAITEHTVPLDLRALRALKQSPLALDLYAWLLHRSFGVTEKGQPAFVPWRSLMGQVGADYARLDNFTAKAKRALVEVQVAAGTGRLDFEEVNGGLMIRPARKLLDQR